MRKLRLAAALVALCAAPGLAGAVRPDVADPGRTADAAAVRSWVIEDFAVDLHVLRSGSIDVTETIRVRFQGAFNGIFRTIPIEYRDPRGFAYTLRVDVREVTDAEGQPLKVESRRRSGMRNLKIWVPGARDATRTVILRYRVANGLRFFEENGLAWDELYWNATGSEWPVPIESASARVRLPSQASGVRARAFTGAYGSSEENATVRADGPRIDVIAGRPLGIHEGLTVDVAWDSYIGAGGGPGAGPAAELLIRRPGKLEAAVAFLRSNWLLVLPILVFVLLYRRWRRVGRDPRRRPITTRYDPPEDMTPSEAGVLIDNRPDMRDITAMLVDLAVRGYLLIEETESEKLLGLVKQTDHVFELRRSPHEAADLKPHERKMISALFDGGGVGARTSVSDLENSFYRDLPGIRAAIFEELIARGLYDRRPDRVTRRYVVAGALIAGGLLGPGIALGARFGLPPVTVVLAGLLSAALIIGFGFVMPARTVAGTRALEDVLGFEEFLDRVEADRFRKIITGPDMFERYLPYAMAFGVEKHWVSAFEDICKEPPDWYRGTAVTGFHPSLFVSQLSGMAGRTATAMASAPRSSGGSGFGGGGGGFSGGGFGGGGGGAF